MSRSNRARQKLVRTLPTVGVALLLLVQVVVLEIRHPTFFSLDDNSTYYGPMYALAHRYLTETGELAHYNFHQFLGTGVLEMGQPGVLYPPIYAAGWLSSFFRGDSVPIIDVLAITHLVAAFLGMFLLLRRLGATPHVAALGGALWTSSPFCLLVGRSWIVVIIMYAWIPWLCWLLVEAVDRRSFRSWLVYVLAKTVYFFHGHPQFFLIACLAELLFYCFILLPRSDFSKLRGLWHYAAANASVLLLSQPLFLPMLRATLRSDNRSSPFSQDEFRVYTIDLWVWLRAQLFVFDESIIGDHVFGYIYFVGVFLLVFVLFAALRSVLARRSSSAEDVQGIFERSFVLSAVGLLLTSIVFWVFYYVPGVAFFRNPMKNFVIFNFFVVLAAATATCSERSRPWHQRFGLLALLATLVANCVIVQVYIAPHYSFAVYSAKRPPDDPLIGYLQDHRFEGRVLSVGDLRYESEPVRVLKFNLASDYGIFAFAGWEYLIERERSAEVWRLNYQATERFDEVCRKMRHLSRWGVRFLLSYKEPSGVAPSSCAHPLEVLKETDDRILVENPAALPLVFDRLGNEKLSWTTRGNAILVENGASRPAREVVFNFFDDPNLRLRLDGEDQPIRSPGLVVSVPSGVETIELRYVPREFRLGCFVALLYLLTFLLARHLVLRRRGAFGGAL